MANKQSGSSVPMGRRLLRLRTCMDRLSEEPVTLERGRACTKVPQKCHSPSYIALHSATSARTRESPTRVCKPAGHRALTRRATVDRIGEYTCRTPAQKTHRSVPMSRRRETQDAEHLSSLPKCVVVPCDESHLRLHGKETKETQCEYLPCTGRSFGCFH